MSKRRSALSVCLLWTFVLVSQTTINFEHLSFRPDDGISLVTHSVEDSLGFVWLAHGDGVSRFDGYVFDFTPKDQIFESRENHDQVKKVFKDSYGTIWVLSENGQLSYLGKHNAFLPIDKKITGFQNTYSVNLVYPDDKKIWLATHHGSILAFDQVLNQVDSITTVPNANKGFNEINAMVAKGSDFLIFSTPFGGMYTYSITDQKREEFKLPEDFVQYGANTILSMDRKDRLWIGSSLIENGLLVYDFDEEDYVQNAIFSPDSSKVPNELFKSIYCDSKGIIWLGTDGSGLYRIDPQSGEWHIHDRNSADKFSLSSNTVIHINEDSHQNLWVFTNYGDINVLRHTPKAIRYHPGFSDGPTRILSSYKASDGTLWIGTDGEGITGIYPDGTENRFLTDIDGNNGLYIQSIKEDRNHNIWVGTYRNGLWIYDPSDNQFTKRTLKSPDGMNVQDVRSIFKDSENRIWVAADLGLYLYSDKEDRLAFFQENTHGLTGTISQSIAEDDSGAIWVAYDDGGLFKFMENKSDITASRFDSIDFSNDKPQQNKKNDIVSIAFDGNGRLWFVDNKGQLGSYSIKSGEYTRHPKNLSHEIPFTSVLVENGQTLWLGSQNGIWRYDVKNGDLETYHKSDGFFDNSYLPRSAHKGTDGYLYFGGRNGLSYFKPEDLKKKPITANLFIGEIEIPNGPLTSILPNQDWGITDRLKLKHNQSSFSFRFLAIDDVLFPNFKYAYRLKDFDDNWTFSRKERKATYTNIPPGEYIFEVKAGLENGTWDIGRKAISLSIAPPFWKTTWAYLIYFLLLLGLIYGIVMWIRLRNGLLAEKLMHEHDKEIFALKMDFFAKMSHEIQTPLTLILTPLDQMMKNALEGGNSQLQQRLRIIANNAKRLSRIVFELTSLRDKEMKKLRLRPSKTDFIGHLKEIASAFEEQANFRDIEFKCSYPFDTWILNYDSHKMEHIIYNLLGNAFKFTPKGGSISMDVVNEEWERSIKISITDSGPGIPKAELDKIFRLFYQGDSGKQRSGTGIGLALTKELVDLHGGTIDVKSSRKRGTCFSVSFPIDEKSGIDVSKEAVEANLHPANGLVNVESTAEPIHKTFEKTLLIVEDNYELQISLRDVFDSLYNVLLAENGEEGYEMTKKHRPDLIISDIMMPKLNGLEMVSLLQKDKLTAHIPIILLTAKKEKRDKITGLRSGALEYIVKPFSTSELIIKVNNILTRSDRLMAKYKNDMLNLPKKAGMRSQDDIFLEQVVESIESKMGNSEFKLEELADDLKISYSTLFRKFQSLTGKTLIEFVRTMRLKKAYLLISEADHGIAQAAFSVGFNDPKYFTRCFRKEFGKTPNSVKKEQKQQGQAAKEMS